MLYSRSENPEKSSDLVCLREHLGYSFSENFRCDVNSGAELLCCLLGQHDETIPDWLVRCSSDGEEKWTSSRLFTISIRSSTATLIEANSAEMPSILEGYFDVESTLVYENSDHIDHRPTFVFDALGSRIEVDGEGWSLCADKGGRKKRYFDPDSLWDIETNGFPSSLDFDEKRLSFLNSCIRSHLSTKNQEILDLTVKWAV